MLDKGGSHAELAYNQGVWRLLEVSLGWDDIIGGLIC